MPLPHYRLRTLMIAVAVAGVVSAAFSSSERFAFATGSLVPAALFSLSFVYTIFLVFGKAASADDTEAGGL